MSVDMRPPSCRTGIQHPKCYARDDSNCSSDNSKEHFISGAILRQIEFGGTVKVAGFKWQEKEKFRNIPSRSLASGILCERHNHALSPLDAGMGAFFETIGRFDASLGRRCESDFSEETTFSGLDIERWMLKCLLGLTASKSVAPSALKPECLKILFRRVSFPSGWGLYFEAAPSQAMFHSQSIAIETRVDPSGERLLAGRFIIRGLPFVLCMGKPGDLANFGWWRPAAIVLKSGDCARTLALQWNCEPHGEAVVLERSGSYEGPSPDWKEWERGG